jgi:hypothetical protein
MGGTANMVVGEIRTMTIWTHIPTDTTLSYLTGYTLPKLNPEALPNIITITTKHRRDVRTAQVRVEVPHIPEENGQVYLEAEEYMRQTPAITPTASWLTQTVITGYVGTGYVTAWPNTGLEITDTYTATSPKLSYTIRFTTPGRYHVWLRGYAAETESDAVYVALDNQPAQLMTGFSKMKWAWWNKNQAGVPVTIEIPEAETGLHTFKIWLAEDGFRLDRILLTLDDDYIPTGSGPGNDDGQANLLPPASSGFESGNFGSWIQDIEGLSITEDAAHDGQYGVKMNGSGRMYYSFNTVVDQWYEVSAWVRLDQVIDPPAWGGLRIQMVDIPSWEHLARSDYLNGNNLPLGEWRQVVFIFQAVGPTSRLLYSNFSPGLFEASVDEFSVRETEAPPPPPPPPDPLVNLLLNNNFERGDLKNWQTSATGMSVMQESSYNGNYGVKLSGTGQIAQSFATETGRQYEVTARVRVDAINSAPSWGGLRIRVVDLPSWQLLAYQYANRIGEWQEIRFGFTAISQTSRLDFSNFSNGLLDGSADDFQVRLITISSRGGRLVRYNIHLPVVLGRQTPAGELSPAELQLEWERAFVSGEIGDILPPEFIAEVYEPVISQLRSSN